MIPTKKMSKTRTRTRRAHQALKPVNYTVCPKCGDAKLPHAMCGKCGFVTKSLSITIGE